MQPLDSGSDLTAARSTLSLTQGELAGTLGVSISTVRRQEACARLDQLIALAVECLLRRARPNSAVVSPEERAERRFREAKRLRELKEEAGMVRKGYEPLPAKVRLDRADELTRLRGIRRRNRSRPEQRAFVADLHVQLAAITNDTIIPAPWPTARPTWAKRNALIVEARHWALEHGWAFAEAYCNAANEGIVPDDSPLLTMPLEPEE